MGAGRIETAGGGNARGLGNDFVDFLRNGMYTGDYGEVGKQYGQNTAGDGLARSNPLMYTRGIAGGIERNLAGDYGRQPFSLDPNMVDFSGIGNIYSEMNSPTGTRQMSPGLEAASNLFSRQQTRNLADLRARHSYQGGGGFGSGAQIAEGNYLAESNAQGANALAEIARGDAGFKLAALGQKINWGQLLAQIAGLNEGSRQFDVGQQGNFLQGLLSLYGGLGSKGIPQAQLVEKPSWWDQLIKAGAAGGQIAAAL
jgi:hypothetical protein